MARYPSEWESDVVLADGGTVHVRPIRPDDEPNLRAMWRGLSSETIYFRFHRFVRELSHEEFEHFTHIDYDDRMALVVELGDDVIAVARYDRLDDDPVAAEVAFMVADAHHGRGIGTILFEHLVAIARVHDIERFVAYVLPENHGMLRVFDHVGFATQRRAGRDLVEVAIPLDLTDRALTAIEDREVRAGARSVARLLAPRSIAVIGASTRPNTIGHEILRNILRGDFTGTVTPVHPTAEAVAGVPATPTVLDVDHEVDLAVVAVPATAVREVVGQCARKGVRSVIVITAGFAEVDERGADAERELASFARSNGMRLVGPNCLGIVNTDPEVRLNATFAPEEPVAGNVGFVSQSGALGLAILDQARDLGLGVSAFLSIGNRADISANDLLEYWEHDDRTDVVLLYLESFGNPRTFGRLARRVSRSKPIVAVKAGRTTAGSRAASSHTAALASPDVAVDALFRQAGVIRVDTLWQLFDVSRVLANQPLPRGSRVCIVGNGGGPAILAADACEREGLEVLELSTATRERLREAVPGAAAVGNPVDLIAAAEPAHFEQALRIVLADADVDAVIVGFTPPLVTRSEEVATAIARAVTDLPEKPVLANFLVRGLGPDALRSGDVHVPSFLFPENAAKALALAARYAQWREADQGSVPELTGTDVTAARAVVDEALADQAEGGWLPTARAVALCRNFGIPVAPTASVDSAESSLAAARSLPGPYALKGVGRELVHKTELGAVRLGLQSPEEVAGAFVELSLRLGDALEGAVVQSMVPEGIETIVGVVHDPDFGPLVMFGMGGTSAEVLGDQAFRILPLTDRDAVELIDSIRGSRLLHGYRGQPAVDVDALADLLLRVGLLADALPEVTELDLNPVMATPDEVTAVDVKIRLAPNPYPAAPGLRRLT